MQVLFALYLYMGQANPHGEDMSNNSQQSTYEFTEAAFTSVAALVADARGNALYTGDAKRLQLGAGYLRLAAQQAAALADLVDAVAAGDRQRGRKAKTRIIALDREIMRHVDVAARDTMRLAEAPGALVLKGEDAQEFLRKVLEANVPPEKVH